MLERSVLAVHERWGIPMSDEGEEFFQDEVSCLYRCLLMLHRARIPAESFKSLARRQVLLRSEQYSRASRKISS